MNRTPLIAGNWKMNLNSSQAEELVEGISASGSLSEELEAAVCPGFLALARTAEAVRGSGLKLGAQNCMWMDSGAFTGQVSPVQLSEFGVEYCIVGHSETRGRFGKLDIPASTAGIFAETDETCGLKAAALLRHGIRPILCVGESLAEREAGRTDEVIAGHLAGGLEHRGGAAGSEIVIAYEPVWAIGTGEVCGIEEAERVCGMIRAWLAENAGEEFAADCRVLYGGSMKPDNAPELLAQPNIDGGLVGGASLKADDFAAILRAATA
jgi:triosephosphate isomerase